MKKIEIQRSNISPKAFYNICKKTAKSNGFCIEDWMTFNDWAYPDKEYNDFSRHEDRDNPQYEVYRIKEYDQQLYLQGSYNFIMEFQFNNEKYGFGYFYFYLIEDKECD